mgnify:CR=1 FL=1
MLAAVGLVFDDRAARDYLPLLVMLVLTLSRTWRGSLRRMSGALKTKYPAFLLPVHRGALARVASGSCAIGLPQLDRRCDRMVADRTRAELRIFTLFAFAVGHL